MEIEYDSYMEANRTKFKRLRLSLNLERLPRRRPRDPEEDLVLMILAYRRWNKELQEGKIIEVSPNHYLIVQYLVR
jgi:hypothetical protein